MKTYETLCYTYQDHIGTITLRRPEHGNALNNTMTAELLDLLPQVAADDGVRAVIFTGAGKNFCAGGDIGLFREKIDQGEYLPVGAVLNGGQIPLMMRRCPKPIVAMVNGAAIGAGASFALGADFRVMEPGSRLGMGFIGMGLAGDTGAIYNLTRIVGAARAAELAMLGTVITGEQALEYGLANRLAAEGGLEEETRKLAAKLAAGPTRAYAIQKDLLYRYCYENFPAYIVGEAEAMFEASKSEDFSEAVNAFLEKRRPLFQGR